MNLKKHLLARVAGRFLFLLVSSVVVAGILSGPAAVALTLIGFILVPVAIVVVAFFWADSVEWARLSVAEQYGAAVQKRAEQAQREDLRSTLDAIGVEALEEVERAIERREENRASS